MTPTAQDNAGKPNRTRDHRQEVTDSIVRQLEQGVAPWQKPWEAGALQMPLNPTTDRGYRGGNTIHLMGTAVEKGYGDPRWLTYKQADAQGWQVRQGEKGAQIEYWEFPRNNPDSIAAGKADKSSEPERTGDDQNQIKDDVRNGRPIHRVYTVFNATQIDGIPGYEPKKREEWEVVHSGEEILRNSGAEIHHDQNDAAFYERAGDRIHLPPKAGFPTASKYYGTALHELAHWSGHPGRLDRQTLTESYRFGDPAYAKEELRAELTSLFLAAERGIPHDPEQHAAYIGDWIRALKDDKNEIFRAAKDASRAADFLMALERGQSVEQALGTGKETVDSTVAQSPLADSLAKAQEISKRVLGKSARLFQAQTDSGIYQGPIIGETEQHVIQQLSSRSSVAHLKDLLGGAAGVGQQLQVKYSNTQAFLTAIEPKQKSRQLER